MVGPTNKLFHDNYNNKINMDPVGLLYISFVAYKYDVNKLTIKNNHLKHELELNI
jgi:hypothetical protein